MKINVYKNMYGYSTLAKNGEDKMYISIQFKKGNEPNLEKAKINIKDAFFSMYKNKVGIAFPKLVVMDYEIEEDTATPQNDFIPPFDDSLPF